MTDQFKNYDEITSKIRDFIELLLRFYNGESWEVVREWDKWDVRYRCTLGDTLILTDWYDITKLTEPWCYGGVITDHILILYEGRKTNG